LFMASRFPHLFAGIAPEVANWQNMNIGSYGWLNVPILVVDGWGDAGYVPENIARFHYLDTMGADIEAIMSKHGHTPDPLDDAKTFTHMMEWARARRRNLWPKRVRYGTFNLYWNRAYWVTIEGMTDHSLGAVIDVRAEAGNRIAVKAKNISSFRLKLSDKLVDPKKDVTVVVNGVETYKDAFRQDLLIELVKRDPARVQKTPKLPGGIMVAMDKAFYADDLRRVGKYVPGQVWDFVRPTKGDDETRKLYARSFSKWARDDTKVDDKLIKNNHLVVWGGPDMNAFCARVADKLPVKIEKGKFTIGSRVYDKPGQSVRFLCPNPLNPKRYLIVYAWNDFKAAVRSGLKSTTPSAWGLRHADCQVWGVNKTANTFSIDMGGGSTTNVDFYTFDAYWRPPSVEPLGTLEHDVDFLSLHVLKADAIQEATGADVGLVGALTPGPNRWGGFLKAGPVTLNDLATTQMFPDYIMTCKVTGKQLKGILAKATVSTVVRDKSAPSYRQGRTLTVDAIQDGKLYTMAADYASCSGVLSYRADTSKIKEAPIVFKDPAAFHAYDGLSLPCSELRQTDIEVTEALAAYFRKRGKVRVRGLCGDLRYYVTNPALHHFGGYDWAHIKCSIPLVDPVRNAPRMQIASLAIGLARTGFKGGLARPNAKALLQFSETATCKADLASLNQKLPVTVRTSSKRFGIAGSCNKPTNLKLVPAGTGKAGEVVIVHVSLRNRSDSDLDGLMILSPSYNSRLHGDAWPGYDMLKRNKNLPALLGLHRSLGHHRSPYQQGGVFLATASRLNRQKDVLAIPGTGYNKGLVGLRKPLTLKAGKTQSLYMVFLAANADNPKKPTKFDFLGVTMALKDQLEMETRQVTTE